MAYENDKLLAQQESLLVLDNEMAPFQALILSLYHFIGKQGFRCQHTKKVMSDNLG